MLKYFLAIAFAAATFFAGADAQLTINTPSGVVLCQPILFSWISGTPPYYVSIHPGNAPSGLALFSFPATERLNVTWLVNLSGNDTGGLTLTLKDLTGQQVQSGIFTVQVTSDTSCLNSTSTTNITGTATTPSPPRLTTTTTSGTTRSTGGGTGSGTGVGTGTGTGTGTTSGSPSQSTSSADKIIVHSAILGVIGIAIFALLT